ncbi:MAG: hypothetical protein ABIM30_00010 [candidate division WOR-3 bacterium]
MKKCNNCGGLFVPEEITENGLCRKCNDWVVNGNPPTCNHCGLRAEKAVLVAWEAKRGLKVRFGAGRYICPECRKSLGLKK